MVMEDKQPQEAMRILRLDHLGFNEQGVIWGRRMFVFATVAADEKESSLIGWDGR